MIYNSVQKEIANKIEEQPQISNWKDWKWQMRHSIRSLDKFEYLTGIKYEESERKNLIKTFEKFPLSITPYYLSLINKKNFLTSVINLTTKQDKTLPPF